MADAELQNWDPQLLWFPKGHEKTGWFKDIAQILVRGDI